MDSTRPARDAVEQVRDFNRYWTRQVGLLRSGLLETPYSLTEARVIFELAQWDTSDASELRNELGLDSGYMSRIVTKLKSKGLVAAEPSARDARRQELRLTRQGRSAFDDLDRRARAQVATLLDGLSEEGRREVVAAMHTIRSRLDPGLGSPGYVIRPPRPGDLGWVVHRHGVLYAEEHGWDTTFEALVADVVADYVDDHDQARENCWIAERDGTPVGSVFCFSKDAETAQLRLLLVEPSARGLGIGSHLVEECIAFARRARYHRMILWTNDVLVAARRIYEAAGFELEDEEQHHSFGHDLVGQHWTLTLGADTPTN